MRVLIAALATAALSLAQPSDVKTGQLANGMKILVQEDHNIPNVAMYFFYKIGSRNDRPGTTGISRRSPKMTPRFSPRTGAVSLGRQLMGWMAP